MVLVSDRTLNTVVLIFFVVDGLEENREHSFMSSADLRVLVADAMKLEVSIDNTVIVADNILFPGVKGKTVVAVNGSVVSNRSDLRDELQGILRHSPNATVTLSFAASQGAVCSPASKRDEFDMDSDEEESALKIRTQLQKDTATQERGAAEDVIAGAVKRIAPGRCILLLCDGFNPSVQVEGAAHRSSANVMHIDPVARIKTRQRLEEFALTLRKSLEKGVWIFIESATKSISLLEHLVECLAAVRAAGSLHANTRILLMCEPHPHFPVPLLEGCIAMRLKPAQNQDNVSAEDLSESRTRMTLLKCHADNLGVTQAVATTTNKKRRVKMNNEVDVVRIETSTFLEMSASAIPPANDREGDNTGEGTTGIERVARYRFGASEKMISLCTVGSERFAVGTSSGYVVVLDTNGLPLIQYRPHKACIWDVAFASAFDFATASEDGTSSVFRYDLAEQELEAASVASFQSDVFAVCYARENDASSAVLSGGLSATVCVLHSDRKSSSFVPATTSIQALCTIPSRGHALVGGGNGVITCIDPESSTVVETSNKHVRKVPAVSACGSSLLTGSFDKTLRVWDYRTNLHCSHNLVMADVLTATALTDTHAAACSGSSLFLWDLRNLNQVLAVKNKAWNGLTRGLVMQGNTLVTASVDGSARFWKFT